MIVNGSHHVDRFPRRLVLGVIVGIFVVLAVFLLLMMRTADIRASSPPAASPSRSTSQPARLMRAIRVSERPVRPDERTRLPRILLMDGYEQRQGDVWVRYEYVKEHTHDDGQ